MTALEDEGLQEVEVRAGAAVRRGETTKAVKAAGRGRLNEVGAELLEAEEQTEVGM